MKPILAVVLVVMVFGVVLADAALHSSQESGNIEFERPDTGREARGPVTHMTTRRRRRRRRRTTALNGKLGEGPRFGNLVEDVIPEIPVGSILGASDGVKSGRFEL